MTSPDVSVIVPVFNVEPYLAQCLDSLIVQDLRKVEIIIVNDGSTDDTEQIAARYAESHPHVRLLNQANAGLSAARNAGMRVATGEYLGFVDGDDWVHSSMYAEMLRIAKETRADLVITNGYLYNDTTRELSPIQDAKVWAVFNAEDRTASLDPRKQPDLFRLDTSACKRLYRRDFLDRLQFTFMPGKIFEDVPTHYRLLLNTTAVALLDRPLYYYRTNRPGRITSRDDETLFDVFDVMAEVMRELREQNAEVSIWANYIWFQNWVLRWLRKQIASPHAAEFDLLCHQHAGSFGTEAIAAFNNKFALDSAAIEFVARQTSGALSAEAKSVGPRSATLHLGNDPIGFFSKDDYTYTPDIWGWICLNYRIQSVLDIGCGIASNLAWFAEYGFDVLGVEGHPRAVSASLLPGKVTLHDFAKGPWVPDSKFDLCLCSEFAEHVEAKYEENWMVAVDQCTYLLLSAAPPGQKGYHHVNLQPDDYWIARFESRGFLHVAEVSRILRDTCARKQASWGRSNLLFFRRAGLMPPSTLADEGLGMT